MRYEVEMVEIARFVVEADDFETVANYLATKRICEIENENNLDLVTDSDDKILNKPVMPADLVLH